MGSPLEVVAGSEFVVPEGAGGGILAVGAVNHQAEPGAVLHTGVILGAEGEPLFHCEISTIQIYYNSISPFAYIKKITYLCRVFY